jgi:hypothetical protein
MKHVCILAAFGFAALALLSHDRQAVTAPAPAPKKAEAVKWEYARLQTRLRSGWTSGTESVLADDDKGLAEKLKVEIPDKADESMTEILILNHVGNQGWEMVTLFKHEAFNFYRFKRPVASKE